MLPPKVVFMKYRWKQWQWPLFHLQLSCLRYVWKWALGCCLTNCREGTSYIGLKVKMIQTGGHAEGRTFNLAREVELIPLLPVYTHSSNASLFSPSWGSSISSIYLLPPTLSQLSQHPHTPFTSPVFACVCVHVYSASILCPNTMTHEAEFCGSAVTHVIFTQNCDIMLEQFLNIKKQ